MIITTNLSMDLQKENQTPKVSAVQGDQNTRCLAVALYSDDTAWQIPADVTVAMRYRKPDATRGYYDTMPDGTVAWTTQGNVIRMCLAPQMLTVPGIVMAQLELILGCNILGTFLILIQVSANPAAGVTTSETYINWLQWMKGELDTYVQKFTGNTESWNGIIDAPINMNGHTLSGLNAPTANDQAANMAFVNQQVKKAAPRNLLDNSDFRNPVNQRGQAIYTGTSSAYTIDRWYSNRASTVVTVGENCLLIDNGAATVTSFLGQKIEKLNDSTYTGGIKWADGIMLVHFDVESGSISNVRFSDNNTLGVNFTVSGGRFLFQIVLKPGKSAEVEYAFLYEGHYTADAIPDYRPKEYAAELTECRRYFYRISGENGYLAAGLFNNTTNLIVPMMLPIAMRTTPTVTHSSVATYRGETVIPAASLTILHMINPDRPVLYVTIASGGIANEFALLYFDGSGYIDFSADL